ncbi:MAG: SAM-dependent methyltransferase [Zetaproteobacteria bacterium]|nr:MAG: SAM-dependent methyltransferase [Zetaproteobacteria bacterium]
MRMALYEPGLGYYERAEVFGRGGDYVTAAELGPWLACGLFDLTHWGWQALGRPNRWVLIEQGGGSGKLLAQLVGLIHDSGMPPPVRVIEVEQSAQLRARQAEWFARKGLTVEQFASLADVPNVDQALLFSNELPDAFPVRCFRWRDGRMIERGVGWNNGAFCWREMDEVRDFFLPCALTSTWPEGYCGEWCPGLEIWQRELAARLARGLVFTVDYGYARSEYYRPGRMEGTLLAHFQHRVVEDVLARVGRQDITAHVDFTRLAELGRAQGLAPLLWMGQGAWLAQSPAVQHAIRQLSADRSPKAMALLAHAKRLLLPYGMGEVFKLLIQSIGVDAEPPQFLARFRRTHALWK